MFKNSKNNCNYFINIPGTRNRTPKSRNQRKIIEETIANKLNSLFNKSSSNLYCLKVYKGWLTFNFICPIKINLPENLSEINGVHQKKVYLVIFAQIRN